MYASRDIKREDTIMFIPDHLLGLSYENGMESPLGQLMKNKRISPEYNTLNFGTNVILAIQNLQEKEKGSDSKF